MTWSVNFATRTTEKEYSRIAYYSQGIMVAVFIKTIIQSKMRNVSKRELTINPREGGGTLFIKRMGVLVVNFQKNPKELPRSCFVGVA